MSCERPSELTPAMMTGDIGKSSIAALGAALLGAAMLVAPMLLSAAGVAALMLAVDAGLNWPWFAWASIAPLLYFMWLILYLSTSALICQQMGKRWPKPRHVVLRPGQSSGTPEELGFVTAGTCYRRLAIVETLPLARALALIPGLHTLLLRAYSPSAHMGREVLNLGRVYDPDLTEVSDNAVLGGNSSIVAHTMTVREDGAGIYASAPIKIGRRATIGGEAYVSLGCIIGEDAVLEPRSFAAPFTRIPPGEVWGGNPAIFRRHRGSSMVRESASRAAESASDADGVESISRKLSASSFNAPLPAAADLRRLVIAALRLGSVDIPAELSSDNCAQWDSLGQMAIAAALFDRYGIALDGEEIFLIRSLRDVQDLVAEQRASGRSVHATTATDDGEGASGAPVADNPCSQLPDDPDMLPLLDTRKATRALAARFDEETPGAQHIRIRIASSFVMQPVVPTLTTWGRAFGFEIACDFSGYDQIVQTLLDPARLSSPDEHYVTVILTRPEDMAADSEEESTDRMRQLLDAISAVTADHAARGQLLVGTLPPIVSAYSRSSAHLAALRQEWERALHQIRGVQVLEFGRAVEELGIERARNSQGEALARTPYSPLLYQTLAIALVRAIRAMRRAPAKVIALDCDNTLWGGVLGEVGFEGIQLGPDGPGRSFQLFQQYLKSLQARGVLLAVASRNELRDVREVFASHPGMILRPEDIAAWRVNWESKSRNLREMAQELRLGVESFVFVDDDPVVRMEVKSVVAAAHVVPLPSDPSRYCETLERLWLFDDPHRTGVDASRTQMMQEETRRKEESTACRSLGEFLAGLDLQIEMGPPRDHEWARVAQLMQRTNQFNLSLHRHTLQELKRIAAQRMVMVVHAQDRFGDYGLVGVCILVPPDGSAACEMDTLLISCRALGRGVEDAFLHGIAAAAARRGASTLLARFIEGPRNGQVKTFLSRCGFTEICPQTFSLPLAEIALLPGHVRFTDRTVAEIGIHSGLLDPSCVGGRG